MAGKTLDLRRVSATSTASAGIRTAPLVCKMIDTSTCIGCKACEVACQEWNDLPPETTVQVGTYQTLPSTTPNFWNLIKFNEYESGTGLHWLMRKDQCMHCAEPGCLEACPAPGAIVQYNNGIVDFQQENCIGCGYCIAGCPFDIPKFNAKTKKVYKCTLCTDRVSVGLEPACIKACPTSCLQFGTKDQMLQAANKRVAQLKATGFAEATVYDPPGVGGTGVITVLALGNNPEEYGLPRDPTIPLAVQLCKKPLKWLQPGHVWLYRWRFRALSALRTQSGEGRRPHREAGRPIMEEARVLPGGRILRYTFKERFVHWIAGISYVYLLLNGLALWSPMFWWMAALLGGGPVARLTHPWVGLVFFASVLWMYRLWDKDMRITDEDRAWNKALGHYVRHEDESMPPAGRFNAGQKYLFWIMFWGGVVLLLTGLVLWFTEYIPWSLRFLRYISVLLHPIAFLVTLAGFIIHVYMGTAVVRGGFTSVIRGEVTEAWAKAHHPLWFKRITGNAPSKK